MTKRDDERHARYLAQTARRQEWHWSVDPDANEYTLKKEAGPRNPRTLVAGRIYRTTKSMGNGVTQRGWGVAKYPPDTQSHWVSYGGPTEGEEFITFLPHMSSHEARAAAKVLLLAGET